GPKSSIATEHSEYMKELLDNDPKLYSDDIIGSLIRRFENCIISRLELNYSL
ncbi:hypothetical protein J3Q64DRAFT_1630832, partial [Phycomyces blakesleeanus]